MTSLDRQYRQGLVSLAAQVRFLPDPFANALRGGVFMVTEERL